MARWSFKKDRRLCELAKSGKTLEQIAKAMHRTPKRIRKSAMRLGVSIKSQAAKPGYGYPSEAGLSSPRKRTGHLNERAGYRRKSFRSKRRGKGGRGGEGGGRRGGGKGGGGEEGEEGEGSMRQKGVREQSKRG